MKNSLAYFAGRLTGMFMLLVLISCASTPVAQKERTAASLSDTKSEVQQARAHIDETLGSLDQLVQASPPNLDSAYKRYAKNVDVMKSEAQSMERRANDVRQRGGQYLASWQRSQMDVSDPQLRNLSQQRRDEVAERLARVNTSFDAAREAFTPFVKDLEDVRKVVGSDLTPTGVAGVGATEVVRNARRHGEATAKQLDTAISEFERIERTLAPPAPTK